jgi:hypothetical protein
VRAQAADLGRELSGPLEVGAPMQFARAFVVPVVCDLLARFPSTRCCTAISLHGSPRPQ